MRSAELFIKDVRKIAKANDITVKLPSVDVVYFSDDPNPSAGYFHSDDKLLVVGTNKPMRKWLSIMVHESCHMDQFIEDQFLWDKCSPGYTIFMDWVSNKELEVKTSILEEAVHDIIRLELDCERRSVRKMREYNLPIDIEEYIRGANVYLNSYLFMMETRTWIPKIYESCDLIMLASTRFSKNYLKIPRRLYRGFKSIYKEHIG